MREHGDVRAAFAPVRRSGAVDRRAPRALGWLRALAGALVLGAGLLAVPATAPSPVAAIGPLPECRLEEWLTVPRDYDSWSVTLVDWLLSVPKDYKPPDLVNVRDAGLTGSGYVRKVAFDDLKAMATAARKNGTPIGSWSAYRSYNQQVKLFNGYVKAYGYENTIEFNHRPGHSEHQLGLAIDFMASGADGMLSGVSATGKWMAKNSWKYGWILSYPRGDDPKHLWNETVCFRYESWHYRYVGREIATQIHDAGLTIREYLWANFTMVDPTTGEPIPSATPSPTASPSPEVSPTATLSAIAIRSPAPPTEPIRPDIATDPAPGGWFGAPWLIAGLLIVLMSVGFIAVRGSRSSRRSQPAARRQPQAIRRPSAPGGGRTTGR